MTEENALKIIGKINTRWYKTALEEFEERICNFEDYVIFENNIYKIIERKEYFDETEIFRSKKIKMGRYLLK